MMSNRAIRLAAGKSQEWVGVTAGVSTPTIRLYELSETAVASERKRGQIARIYQALLTTIDPEVDEEAEEIERQISDANDHPDC